MSNVGRLINHRHFLKISSWCQSPRQGKGFMLHFHVSWWLNGNHFKAVISAGKENLQEVKKDMILFLLSLLCSEVWSRFVHTWWTCLTQHQTKCSWSSDAGRWGDDEWNQLRKWQVSLNPTLEASEWPCPPRPAQNHSFLNASMRKNFCRKFGQKDETHAKKM